jgi:K+-transporting ATPase ATPase C chain
MRREIGTALRLALASLLLAGLLYPLLATGLAQILCPARANGSLLLVHGRLVGSMEIGQRFTSPAYFQGRPSAAGPCGYDASGSGGSNLGPTSRELRARMERDLARLLRENPGAPGPVPPELVAASASGLDPEVSPEAARWQAPRVAAARAVPVERVEHLIREHVEPRTLGFLGEPRVNVLLLNLDLDSRLGPPPAASP